MAGFNKMFIMLPLIFAARKLDGEDPQTVQYLRLAYFSVQALIVAVVVYVYIQASNAAGGNDKDRIIYVPPAPQPFADPNAKKKYTETKYGAHILSQARSLLGSTLFGIALTSGLHFYRGMVIGLAIQSIMGPMNLMENALVKALIFSSKGQISPELKIFEEKSADELTSDDEIVDESGNPVIRSIGGAAAGSNNGKTLSSASFEDLLLDTWDSGAKADIAPLMAALNKKNSNFTTKDNGWTPLMILSGLTGVKGCGSAVRHVISDLGGNPAMTDGEGWNALHWAAFHGSAEAAKVLCEMDGKQLGNVEDKEGKKPLQHAKSEGNSTVVQVLEEMDAKESLSEKPKENELRKRK